MNDHVWLCNSLAGVRNWRALTSDLAERDRDFAVEAGKRNDRGETLGADYFPKTIWPKADAKPSDTAASDFLYAGTHWIVSARFAQLLQEFEMGGAHLHPVAFLEADCVTPLKGAYFCIEFGNSKRALLPDQSNGIRPTFKPDEWRLKASVANDSVVLSEQARIGGAIWIDPALKDVVCLDGRLGDAMYERKILDGFRGLGDMKRAVIR